MYEGFIIGMLVVITLALGVLMYKAFRPKYSGDIEIAENEQGAKVFSLVLYSDPEELEKMRLVTFRVISDS